MKPRVYHLKVHFVSTASRGKAEPVVTKEKGLHMIKKALRRTDVPGEVRRKLSEWLIDNSEKGDGSESSFVRVSVKERHENYEAPLGLLINIVKVSHLGSVHLEVMADRVEVPDSLLGLSAMAVANYLKSKTDVEELQLPGSLEEEVARLVGGIACGSGNNL